ncbi:hypothetical protein [Ruegeria arenilitoris]|uniref:hypothetical protein n=1 Tax=Ruegeria arenilitoris TaxID=1173585 RepID=UPI001480102D|nr:hypothetical protein [Ruegeria arenilitoris]
MSLARVSILALASFLLAAPIAAEEVSAIATIDMCEARYSSITDLVERAEGLGWKRVKGAEAEKVVDRTVWIGLPFLKSDEIDPDDPNGTFCGGFAMDCHLPEVGQAPLNDQAHNVAFSSGTSALLILVDFGGAGQHFKADFVEYKSSCTAIFGQGKASRELGSAFSRPELKRNPSGTSQVISERTRNPKLDWPYPQITHSTSIHAPYAHILEVKDLEWLNYVTGFGTGYSYTYQAGDS